MPRKSKSSLSASEDMISLQRYPKKYAVTLNKKDYNARVLAKYYMGKTPSEMIIPHSRRAISDMEFETVLQRIKGTPIAAYYHGSSRKPSSLASSSSAAYDWSPAGPASRGLYKRSIGVPVVRSTAVRRRGPGAQQSVVPHYRRRR